MLIALWLCVSSILVGCSKSSASAPTTKPTDVGPTYVAPDGTGTKTVDSVEYEYVATPERETQITTGFPKLKGGQTREEVRNALGLPDSARPGYSKAYNSQFLGWGYMYRMKMRAGSPNTNDVCVQVFFDPAGKLKWAVPSHIAGLKEVGSPAGP
jgi:hypothetical protein